MRDAAEQRAPGGAEDRAVHIVAPQPPPPPPHVFIARQLGRAAPPATSPQ